MAANGAQGTVVAVHRSGTHSMSKPSQSAITLVAGIGVMGDAHSGATVKHRSRVAKDPQQPNLRQVHLLHAELLDDLARRAPGARVLADRVFVEDGPLLSSAGVTAGIDLALHCIARHAGEALAAEVAQVMVVFHRRGAGDPERSPLLAGRSHLHPAVHRVQNAVGERPAEDWSLERLAAEAHVTPRHLGRLFATHVGCTPRDFVEQVRCAFMREALAAGWPTARALALAGFSDDRQWRRARARQAASVQADPA